MIPCGAFWSRLGWNSGGEPGTELRHVALHLWDGGGWIMLNQCQGQVLEIIVIYTIY